MSRVPVQLLLLVLIFFYQPVFSQTYMATHYNVVEGTGNGVRFWSSDLYKIHMGLGPEYQYGPVTDFSIKSSMNVDPGRGWTWGIAGQTPIAAIGTNGHMQIAGNFVSGGNSADAGSRWLRVGESHYATYPLNMGTNMKSGFASIWDTDGVFFGMSDEGSNRKDAIIAWGDDGNDMLRFLFNNGELMRLSPAGALGLGTTNSPQVKFHVFEAGSSTVSWRGRIVASGANQAVVMGEYDGKALFGAHTPALNSWSDLHMQILGKLGIGTMSPTSKVEIIGAGGQTVDLKVNGRIQTGDGANGGGVNVTSSGSMFMGAQSATKVGLYNNDWRLIVDNAGKVGIGTISPDEKLTVKGKVHAEEVIIDLSVPAPDYVFEQDYTLTPLDEVQAYIAKNKHLPEVPSAKEIEKDGVRVGEMEMLLLKKVEELTLHLIKKDQELKNLEERLKILEQHKD